MKQDLKDINIIIIMIEKKPYRIAGHWKVQKGEREDTLR